MASLGHNELNDLIYSLAYINFTVSLYMNHKFLTNINGCIFTYFGHEIQTLQIKMMYIIYQKSIKCEIIMNECQNIFS